MLIPPENELFPFRVRVLVAVLPEARIAEPAVVWVIFPLIVRLVPAENGSRLNLEFDE